MNMRYLSFLLFLPCTLSDKSGLSSGYGLVSNTTPEHRPVYSPAVPVTLNATAAAHPVQKARGTVELASPVTDKITRQSSPIQHSSSVLHSGGSPVQSVQEGSGNSRVSQAAPVYIKPSSQPGPRAAHEAVVYSKLAQDGGAVGYNEIIARPSGGGAVSHNRAVVHDTVVYTKLAQDGAGGYQDVYESAGNSRVSHEGFRTGYIEPLPSEFRTTRCNVEVTPGAVLGQINELDYQLASVLGEIPAAIAEARVAIARVTADTNRDKFLTGLTCFSGALSGSLGAINGQDLFNLPIGNSLLLAAQNLWGYGYWGPFFLDLQDTDPGCGVEEFNAVVNEYSFLTSLDFVYGPDPTAGGFVSQNPDDRPEVRKYYLGEFSRKLKLALFCITSQAGSVEEASKVVTLIDKYVQVGNDRLDLTARLMP